VREIRRGKARIERSGSRRERTRNSISSWAGARCQMSSGQHSCSSSSTASRRPEPRPALSALADAGVLSAADASVLADAYRFCEETRNRLYLVRAAAGDALPAWARSSPGWQPAWHDAVGAARGVPPADPALRQVVERIFYGAGG